MKLPYFKYHPAPTASVGASDTECVCCNKARGYIYAGPVYAIATLSEGICPQCIADGTAHQNFNAMFVDDAGVGGYHQWDTVSEEIVAKISYRTPGFSGWQQEQWWTHCDDATEFLGIAGYKELQQYGEEAITFFREQFNKDTGMQGTELDNWFKAFHSDYGPTAYVFRCRHCHKMGGYWDCH